MKTRRIIWGIVLAGFVGVAGYGIDRRVKYVNGYCHAEKRYVSDNEVVDAAVGQLLKNLKEEYVGMTPEEQANTVVYTGLEDFYKAQPRCCGLSKNKGKSAKPPKPFPFGENLVPYFGKHITYRHDLVGQTPFRTARIRISLCATSAVILTDYVGRKKVSIGQSTEHNPNQEGNKANDRRFSKRKLTPQEQSKKENNNAQSK